MPQMLSLVWSSAYTCDLLQTCALTDDDLMLGVGVGLCHIPSWGRSGEINDIEIEKSRVNSDSLHPRVPHESGQGEDVIETHPCLQLPLPFPPPLPPSVKHIRTNSSQILLLENLKHLLLFLIFHVKDSYMDFEKHFSIYSPCPCYSFRLSRKLNVEVESNMQR